MGISEKLAYLYETKERIKSALNTPYNVYRDYATLIEKYVKNQPKSIVEGSSAICENAVDLPCNVTVNGNSYQETTEGYNIFNLNNFGTRVRNGVTVTQNKDDSLNATGVGTSSYIIFLDNINITDELEDGETYTLWCNNPNSLLYAQIGIVPIEGTTKNITTSSRNVTFTVDKSVNSSYSIRLQSGSGSVNATYNLSDLQFMLYKGTDTKPYEPYTNGASPNTEYKQDIEVIDGVNRFDGEIELGTLASGNNVNSTTIYRSKNYNKVKANTDYTFSINSKTNRIGVMFYNKEKVWINSNNSAQGYLTDDSGKFTTPNDCEYVKFRSFTDDFNLFADGKIQINEGGLLPYLPYGHIGVKQGGINKVDISNVGTFYYGTFESGIITTNAITAERFYNLLRLDFNDLLDVKVGKTYYVSFDVKIQSGTIERINAVQIMDGNRVVVSSNIKNVSNPTLNSNYQRYVWSVDISAEGAKILFIQGYNSNECILNIKNIMISELNIPYEPHIEPIVHSIDLAGEKLAKVGEIADLLNIGVDGSVSIEKKTGRDNLEKAYYGRIQDTYDTNRYRFNTNALIGKIKPDTLMLCNRFRGSLEYQNLWVDSYVINPSSGTISFYKNGIKTLEEWNAWVSENELDVLYELLNPQTIPLPSIEPITLFEGTNVFELVTNLGTTMKVEYVVNAETLQNEIKELTNAVIELGGTL